MLTLTEAAKQENRPRPTLKKYAAIFLKEGRLGVKKVGYQYEVSRVFLNWVEKNVPRRGSDGE